MDSDWHCSGAYFLWEKSLSSINKLVASSLISLKYLFWTMKKYLLLFYVLPFFSLAQSDVVELKKHGANQKVYAPGMSLTMETIYHQWLDGTITAIRNDSVFLNGIPFHYKEISRIRTDRKKFNYSTNGTILLIAGGGVLLLGAVNGLYRGDQIKDWYKPSGFITAGAFIALGLLMRNAAHKKYTLGKKYSLEYLALSANKN